MSVSNLVQPDTLNSIVIGFAVFCGVISFLYISLHKMSNK